MGEAGMTRVEIALDVMWVMENIYRFYFVDGHSWSKEAKPYVERRRLVSKTKGLIMHDRIIEGRKI